jgi:redox-sensing transcriptional repressor
MTELSRAALRALGRAAVPDATVARLPVYLRVLGVLADQGLRTVSSETLAGSAGVTSAKVRKDLSHLGSFGTRGVGYDLGVLIDCISTELGLTEDRSVLLAGVGNLGHALARYGGFQARGFRVVALVDADESRIGEVVSGVAVSGIVDLEMLVTQKHVTIGVICTPAEAAQSVCDRLVAAGVTSILNFAPTVLSVPDGVDVRKVDLAVELQILSFHEARKRSVGVVDPGGAPPGADGAGRVRVAARDQESTRAPLVGAAGGDTQ